MNIGNIRNKCKATTIAHLHTCADLHRFGEGQNQRGIGVTNGVRSRVDGFSAFRMRQRVVNGSRTPQRNALYDARICVYCWRRSKKWLEYEHVEPLTRGGKHDWANIAMVCARCNRSKGNRFLLEWVMSDCPGVRPCFKPPIHPSEVRGAA